MSLRLLSFCQLKYDTEFQYTVGGGGEGEGKPNDSCLRRVQNKVGRKEFFKEGSHFANPEFTPSNLQMGNRGERKKKAG